jgi:hypothetical protein
LAGRSPFAWGVDADGNDAELDAPFHEFLSMPASRIADDHVVAQYDQMEALLQAADIDAGYALTRGGDHSHRKVRWFVRALHQLVPAAARQSALIRH